MYANDCFLSYQQINKYTDLSLLGAKCSKNTA